MTLDYIIVGAGPAGLACAIEAHKLGRGYLVIDKGCLAESIYRFPADMVFFSTPDLLSIGELVFVSQSFRPNRMEALHYYRAVADHYKIRINTFERVLSIKKDGDAFAVVTKKHTGQETGYTTSKVVIATGYYDNPNLLHIPGEDLPKVSHYYFEAHPYHNMDVAVIGAKNSAVEAALLLYRAGARVTLIHRGESISHSVKYWVRPDIDKRLADGHIKALFNSEVVSVHPDTISVRNNTSGETKEIKNDFVFALTGYHPDTKLLSECGVAINPETLAPEYDPATMETNVPGLYVAGSVAAGINNNKIFIENSRDHGKLIIR